MQPRTLITSLPGGRPTLRRIDRLRHLRLIMNSGIFDLEWYRHQTPEPLPSLKTAVLHYLDRGRLNSLTPALLFDPAWFDPVNWRRKGSTDPLVRYLLNGKGAHGPHPLFDDAQWSTMHPEAAHHPGRALGHFLAAADDATVVPVPAGMPVLTKRALVDIVSTASDEWSQGAHQARKRSSQAHSSRADRRFRAKWAGAAPRPSYDRPLVTVITPVHNRPTQVLAAVASVQAQSLTDWEMIVVDDGSTDATAEAVQILAAADRRIRVLRLPHTGVCAARNAGITVARGRYVAFLDSDNLWRHDFLELMTAALHGTGLRAAYSALKIVDGAKSTYLAFKGNLEDLRHGNHVDLNTLVVEHSLLQQIGGFDTTLRRMVDYDLAVRIERIAPLQLFNFVGTTYHIGEELGPRISTSESTRWDEAVKNRLFIDWPTLRAESAQRVAGRVSVLLPAAGTVGQTLRCVAHLLRHARRDAADDIEIVVVDNGGTRSTWVQLSAALRQPNIRLIHLERDSGPVLGCNRALAVSTGEFVVIMRPDVVVDGPWAAPLRQALADPAVTSAQPLVLDAAGLICSAGIMRAESVRAEVTYVPALIGLPPHDAEPLLGRPVPAAVGPMVAMRADDLVQRRLIQGSGGLDPLLDLDAAVADASWNAPAHPRGHGVVVPDLVVRRLDLFVGDTAGTPGAATGFPADDHERRVLRGRDGSPPLADPRPALARVPGQLRWAIKTAAPAGPTGDNWGDVHFAAALRRALVELGHHVVIDRREAHTRPTAELDDVVLTLRGLDRVTPQPGAINLLWVISHPELVTAEELTDYDRVFAASATWAATMSAITGRQVEPLLQATDPQLFHPDRGVPGSGPAVLFVGNSRNVLRPMVRDALAAELPLTLYGSRWEKLVDPTRIAGTFIANDELGGLYRSAGVVLSDHWDDMAREGFLSNRLFDAVASGARVISDPVPGLHDVFGPEVQVAATIDDLIRLATEHSWPAEPELRAASELVRNNHTFAARGARLDAVVRELRPLQSGLAGRSGSRTPVAGQTEKADAALPPEVSLR